MNITSVIKALLPISISGQIIGADGVTITLSGDMSGTQVVNDGEYYNFTVEYGGNYTITPSLDGIEFNPSFVSFIGVESNEVQDFSVQHYFSIGSTMEEVRLAQGTPDEVSSYGTSGTYWYYGYSYVKFSSETALVTDYYDSKLGNKLYVE